MFAGAKLKIERADHHIADLERDIITFTRKNLNASIRQRDSGKTDISITVHEPPPAIGLMVGDAIHNLRTALDHMTWEMVGRDGGAQDRHLKFPTGDERVNFESTCNGIKTPSRSVKDALIALEVFPRGKGDLLYEVSALDNVDKHTILIPTTNAPRMSDLVFVTKDARRILSEVYGSDATFRHGETLTIDGAPAGARLEFKDDAQATNLVVFGNVRAFENKPILPTLTQLRHAVADVIDVIKRAIIP